MQKVPFIIISFFLVLLIIGIATNETGMVLEQAIKVCLSCIGIG